MDRQGCEKMETPNQTKRKPNLRKQGQVPEGSAFPLHPGFASLRPLLLPRSALRALTCPAPAPRLPRSQPEPRANRRGSEAPGTASGRQTRPTPHPAEHR